MGQYNYMIKFIRNLRYIPKEFSLTFTVEWKLLSKGLYLKGKILVLEITYGKKKYIIECMMGEPKNKIKSHRMMGVFLQGRN